MIESGYIPKLLTFKNIESNFWKIKIHEMKFICRSTSMKTLGSFKLLKVTSIRNLSVTSKFNLISFSGDLLCFRTQGIQFMHEDDLQTVWSMNCLRYDEKLLICTWFHNKTSKPNLCSGWKENWHNDCHNIILLYFAHACTYIISWCYFMKTLSNIEA